MESTKRRNRGSRVTIVAALVVAFLVPAGCSMIDLSPTDSEGSSAPTSQQDDASSYTIEETTGGFIYTDVPSGYAVTFPQRPDVEPLSSNSASDQPANYVFADITSGEFVSIGQVIDKTPELRSQLMGFVQSLNPSGQLNASSYTLGGLDAVWAEFTTGDSSGIPSNLAGQPCETVMAGDGHNFYHLVAIGGSSDERQAFFDSFKRIDE